MLPGSEEASPSRADSLKTLLEHPEQVSITEHEAGRLSAGQARERGDQYMDRVLHIPSARRRVGGDEEIGGSLARSLAPLLPSAAKSPLLAPAVESKVSLVPGETASPSTVGKVWRWIGGLFKILPDAERNAQLWKFMVGQALIVVGINFHYSSMEKLVSKGKADSANVSYARSTNWAAQAVSSVVTGPLTDKMSVKKILVASYLGRSMLLLSVPILFFTTGSFSFPIFLATIFLAGFLQSAALTGGSVAFNRLLADNEEAYNRANAVYMLLLNVVGVIAPLVAGSFIGFMNAQIGLLAGNVLAYGVYGVLALTVALMYWLRLKIPQDALLQARRELAAKFKSEGGPAGYKGVTSARINEEPTLLVEVEGEPSAAVLPFKEFNGFTVKAVKKTGRFQDLIHGFKLILKDRFLRWTLLLTTLYVATADAMIFAALPRYIGEIMLPVGALAIGTLKGIPLIGPFLAAGLSSPEGIFGMYLSATALGMGISTMAMLKDDKVASEESILLQGFRVALAKGSLEKSSQEAAVGAVRAARVEVLASYQEAWKKDREAVLSPDDFVVRVQARARLGISEELGLTEAEAARLMEETGIQAGLGSWARRHFAALIKEARREAATGHDALERQGRWGELLLGAGLLAYWGVFFFSNFWLSLGSMFLVALLSGPSSVIWSSLLTRVLVKKYPEHQGKITASMSFYQLIFSVAGLLTIGLMMAAVPTVTALWIIGVTMTVAGGLDILLPFLALKKDPPAGGPGKD